jgi:hypothetical protein
MTAEQSSPSNGPPERNGKGRLSLAWRLSLLFVAAAAAVAAFRLAALPADVNGRAGARYACPMHPEVSALRPGICPICRMALVPIATTAPVSDPDALVSSPEETGRPGIADRPRPMLEAPASSAPAWVAEDGTLAVLLYRDEVATLRSDERGDFVTRAGRFHATKADTPAQAWDATQSVVHFRPEADGLPAGSTGWLEIPARPGRALAVLGEALLATPEGYDVLTVDATGYRVRRTRVEIGSFHFGFGTVLSGLAPDARVVVRKAFFFDAERRLRVGRSEPLSRGE